MKTDDIQVTKVFQENWGAVHERNPDGTRKYRYIVNEGSSRSSKTRSIIQLYYLYALQNSLKRMSVWRSTKTDCRATVLKDMEQVYPSMPYFNHVTLNKTDSIFKFSFTGSAIEINGTDEANRIHGYNGEVAWFNECYDISRDVFDQIDMRTTDFVIIDWNPKQAHWIEDLKKDQRTLVIRSTFRDNPFCPEEQKLKILSYQPVKMTDVVIIGLLSEGDAKAYNLSENPLKLSERQVKELARCKENERKGSASSFNWSVYGLGIRAERPNRIFTWTEISDDEYNKIDATRYYAVDWGVVDPFGILEGKYLDGCLYLHEKNYLSENQIMEKLTPAERELLLKQEEGLIGWLFERLNIPKSAYIPCDNNRPLKVIALRKAGWDYALTAVKGQGSVVDGISLLSKLKVFYTSSSPNLKNEQENYSRQVDRYGSVLEEPEDFNNHLMDPARYMATYLQLQGIIKLV